MLAFCDSGANGVGIGGKRFDPGAGIGELRLVGFAALEAGKFFVFEAVGLGGGKLDFVFNGFSLRGGLDGVELSAKAGSLFAVFVNFALQARAQRIFTRQRGGDFGRAILCGGERRLSAGNFARERAQLLVDTVPLHFEVLQFHESCNALVHHVQKAYGMERGWGKWGRGGYEGVGNRDEGFQRRRDLEMQE
jgi:hypothetical protein